MVDFENFLAPLAVRTLLAIDVPSVGVATASSTASITPLTKSRGTRKNACIMSARGLVQRLFDVASRDQKPSKRTSASEPLAAVDERS